MCNIFRQIEPESYSSQTRSVRLGGHVTSIRLELLFWNVLDEIAAMESVSLGRLLTKLYDEILSVNKDIGNFTSLLRCACIQHVAETKSDVALKHKDAEHLKNQERRKLGEGFATTLLPV